jgi:hypothetical protein
MDIDAGIAFQCLRRRWNSEKTSRIAAVETSSELTI